MHFIVTGGAGFIGSHLSSRLLAKGHQVTVVDDFRNGCRTNFPDRSGLYLLNKDIAHCLPEDFAPPVDGLVHLAAEASVMKSWAFPQTVHQNNLSNVIKIIELSRILEIPRIVFASSAAVYGENVTLPITEDQVCQPISPYGLQKLSAERYLELFARQIGFSAISLRLFNVYGSGQLPDSEYTGVISKFMLALRQNQPITIYGDGDQIRDFIYIEDVGSAFERALIIPMNCGQSLSCNIGTGLAISINDLLQVLRNLVPENSSKLCYAPVRQGDIQNSHSDITLARQHLGFEPVFTIKTGLQDCFKSKNIWNAMSRI